MQKGINIGSGAWLTRPKNWAALDKCLGHVLEANTVFDCPDNEISYAYSSHFFEHIDNITAKALMKETHRVLSHDGVFRILVPNFDLILNKFNDGDESWFINDIQMENCGRGWEQAGVPRTLENTLLHIFSNYDHQTESGFYRGPPKNITKEKVQEMAKNPAEIFSDWIVKQIPTAEPGVTTQHINYWGLPKLGYFLFGAGFKEVSLVPYGVSKIPEVESTPFFDNAKDRKTISLCVEAVK